MRRLTWLLRMIALLGPMVVLWYRLETMPLLQARQEEALHDFAILAFVVGLTWAFLIPSGMAGVIHRPDLLVPAGLWISIQGLLAWLGTLPALQPVIAGAKVVNFLGIAIQLSFFLFVEFLLAVVFVGWTYHRIFQWVIEEPTELIAPLRRMSLWGVRSVLRLFSVG